MKNKIDKGIIFFLPVKTRPKEYPIFSIMKKWRFWHTGIIYSGKVYETFNFGKYSIKDDSERKKELDKQKAIYFDSEINVKKLMSEIKSGTSCEEFVLRVLGKSNLTGSSKGKFYPDDVYRILKREK